jgi:hypothetical protein
MKNDINEHIKTMSLLLRSSARYVYNRIAVPDHKKAYKLAMDACLSHIDEGWQSLDILRSKIDSVREDVETHYKKGLFLKNAENIRYYLMACDHADDVINSIERRFITGVYDVETTKLTGKEVDLYEDQSVF